MVFCLVEIAFHKQVHMIDLNTLLLVFRTLHNFTRDALRFMLRFDLVYHLCGSVLNLAILCIRRLCLASTDIVAVAYPPQQSIEPERFIIVGAIGISVRSRTALAADAPDALPVKATVLIVAGSTTGETVCNGM